MTAPNITQDKETGIGKYTDAEFKELLRKGIKRNGVPVAMVMPSGFYEIMTDSDLDAVIAYLRTIKPITNTVPDPIYRMPQGHPIPPGGDKIFTEAMLSDKKNKGFYLVTIAHCMECHTPMGPHGREFATRLGTGGFEFPGPWGVSVSGNITSSRDKGIGAWTDDEIKRAITQGISRDGSKLKPPMGFIITRHLRQMTSTRSCARFRPKTETRAGAKIRHIAEPPRFIAAERRWRGWRNSDAQPSRQ